MNTWPKQNEKDKSAELPKWEECDLFCIQDYAGTGPAPCGWRGGRQEALRDETGTKLICPRCRCATLFRIPFGGAGRGAIEKQQS